MVLCSGSLGGARETAGACRGHLGLAHTTNRASCTNLPQSAGVGA
ncbi:hypothetical protein RM6536_1737 [Rothia mucilaginosa]|uniref:Uncharacterized protein n=1 Tax=Rothia mucilaginosa TaxID=43675 RepID=A0A0K2S1L5_9MICC|nr:hypothetical protein RM6536_1737 [Rothia mucilaginosa]